MSPKVPVFHLGDMGPSNIWFLGPTRVCLPKRHLDRIFVWVAVVTDTQRQTDHAATSVYSNSQRLAWRAGMHANTSRLSGLLYVTVYEQSPQEDVQSF